AMRAREGLAGELARAGDGPGPEPAGLGLGDVERAAVGRQADAVGARDRVDDLDDRRAVGAGVVDAAAVEVAGPGLAEVGEPEAPVGVEDDVVRPAQAVLADAIVEDVDAARIEVDALDPATAVVGRLEGGHPDAGMVAPLEAAVVADVAGTVGADRCSVGTAAGAGDDARL